MMENTAIPKFNSEAEEAQWWYENREWLTAQFQQAAREGRLKRGSTVLERTAAVRGSHLLTVALSAEDLEKIHELAEKRKSDDSSVAAELLSGALKSL